VALVGESGSGKSVTSLATMGLLPESKVKLLRTVKFFLKVKTYSTYRARNAKKCGKDIAMIFQEPMSSLNPVFTVGSSNCRNFAVTFGYES
jgi:peptide/nickel transport system ATP-binding protein